MEKFVALLVMTAFLSVAGFMITRSVRSGASVSGKARAAPAILLAGALMIICDLTAGQGTLLRLPFDLMLLSITAFSLNSTVIPPKAGCIVALLSSIVVFCLSVYYLLCALSWLPFPSRSAAMAASAMGSIFMAGIFFCGIACRIRNISSLMASGNAWDMLTFGTDTVYVLFCLAETTGLIVALTVFCVRDCVAAIFPVLSGAGVIALALRLGFGSVFVLASRHELRIAGALKVPKEAIVPRHSDVNETYREIYSRVVLYFEEEKPYLNGDLTINDVVKSVYTNKLYISKAISQCAGRNFCQFVNYYRVMYSIESYRLNPEMRVADMWQGCGFNSIVSYNMAFKLFMGENPSDWCRKEKARLARCKK